MDEKPARTQLGTMLVVLLMAVFLAWMCWLATSLVMIGVPDEDRASVIVALIAAALAGAVSGMHVVKSTFDNPIDFVMGIIDTLMRVVRRP